MNSRNDTSRSFTMTYPIHSDDTARLSPSRSMAHDATSSCCDCDDDYLMMRTGVGGEKTVRITQEADHRRRHRRRHQRWKRCSPGIVPIVAIGAYVADAFCHYSIDGHVSVMALCALPEIRMRMRHGDRGNCHSHHSKLRSVGFVQQHDATIMKIRPSWLSSQTDNRFNPALLWGRDECQSENINNTTKELPYFTYHSLNGGVAPSYCSEDDDIADMTEDRNGVSQIYVNGAQISGKPGDAPPIKSAIANGFHQTVTTSGSEKFVSGANGKSQPLSKENKKSTAAWTAPEVNKWTALMAEIAKAAMIYRNGRRPSLPSLTEEVQSITKGVKSLSAEDNKCIATYWQSLLPNITYLGTENVNRVKEALRIAYYAHKDQKRKSGEPFIIHPIEVTQLLAGLKMDTETIMSGLLHDTVEDTDLTFAQLEVLFGHMVRSIVEGETKVSKLPKLAFTDYADEQAENLRQMFVAMTDDYRIIIVKLADRLHNMRTLRFMKPEKQIKISRETLDIFAPLAHRMGIWQFKSELEDISFMYLYPAEYKQLNRRLRRHQTSFRETLDKSQEILRKTLESDATLREQAQAVEVYGRTKELYSLWHKMESKADHDLDRISDVVALRVILHPKESSSSDVNGETGTDRGVWLCYHVLGLVQHLPGFQPVPTKVKDYISFPKPNGYQSLHTALMLNGQTIEVQIRTAAMHQVAEYGMASHWSYTDRKRGLEELYNTPWLSTIKEWQDDVVCSRDFVDSVRRELLGKRVFVFLRNGKILNLARGATVIDAAFQIHAEVGLSMHGAVINGKPAPLSYELKNGDVVSILTGDGKPTTDWMRYAKSRSTRSKLRSYFHKKQRESLKEAGHILLSDFLKIHKRLIYDLSFLNEMIPTNVEQFADHLPGNTRYHDIDELLLDIGRLHDRDFLRSVVSKVLKVPLWAIIQAEKLSSYKNRQVTEQVFAEVRQSRRLAKDAAMAAREAEIGSNSADRGGFGVAVSVERTDRTDLAKVGSESGNVAESSLLSYGNVLSYQKDIFANPDIGTRVVVTKNDNLCEACLPVRGDDIVGARPCDERPNGVITVHRVGCIKEPLAVVGTTGGNLNNTADVSERNGVGADDSILENSRRSTLRNDKLEGGLVPLRMCWSDGNAISGNDCITDDATYLVEVAIIANDRKMLLADCSEIVSEKSFILRTGSSTSLEHATLEFLIKVRDLDHLQHVMECLRQIPSVLSVDRKRNFLPALCMATYSLALTFCENKLKVQFWREAPAKPLPMRTGSLMIKGLVSW